MKPITAIIVFFSLMFPALFLGYNNYAEAKENIIKDVNQALAKTVIYKMPTKITADTLQVFKSNLQINQLKETTVAILLRYGTAASGLRKSGNIRQQPSLS